MIFMLRKEGRKKPQTTLLSLPSYTNEQTTAWTLRKEITSLAKSWGIVCCTAIGLGVNHASRLLCCTGAVSVSGCSMDRMQGWNKIPWLAQGQPQPPWISVCSIESGSWSWRAPVKTSRIFLYSVWASKSPLCNYLLSLCEMVRISPYLSVETPSFWQTHPLAFSHQ